jgi:uncharacterized membrane protein HdeD (DUF308 family)
MFELVGALAKQTYRSLLGRGAIACLVGILCLALPGLSLAVAVALFGAYLFVDGILLIASGARPGQRAGRSWAAILIGALSSIAGVLSFYRPAIALATMVFIIALRSLVLGGMELGAALVLPKGSRRGWIALSGVLSVVFAVLLVIYPIASTLALLWVIGVYAIAYGATLVYLAFRVKGAAREVLGTPSHPSMPRFSH